jgi:two-component system chemotaxis response regulator CheB
MIKVLLVDDSPVALAVLKRMLAKSPEIEVVGTAANGREALHLIPLVNPDVVCTDLHMPVMDGLEFTKEAMARHPLPILLVSISGNEDSLNAFRVLEAGAVDVLQKPRAHFELDFEKLAPELATKIKILAGVHVFRRRRSEAVSIDENAGKKQLNHRMVLPELPLRMVVIGASTGGPTALQTILAMMPADFPLPIICIQHISEGFLQGLVDWLTSRCRMKVEIARAEAFPQPGTIYFPQENTHLTIDHKGRFAISAEPPCEGHRPSVTVAMNSVAKYYGNSVLGILLTGMGRDGAEGLQTVRRAGGVTIAQDEETCIVFGMPQQAIMLGAAEYVVPLDEIGSLLLHFASPLLG